MSNSEPPPEINRALKFSLNFSRSKEKRKNTTYILLFSIIKEKH